MEYQKNIRKLARTSEMKILRTVADSALMDRKNNNKIQAIYNT